MRTPRHISMCVDEWLDGCPFNLPDALTAIREEYEMASTPHPANERGTDHETTEMTA